MCDAMSLASAGTDILGGIAGSIDAKSRASFEAAQMDTMKILAGSRTSSEEGALREAFTEQMGQNIAAAAISGFAQASFEAVNEGNEKNLSKNVRQLHRNLDSEKRQIDVQKMVRLLDGKMEADAFIFSGISSAIGTLTAAESTYQDTRVGKTDAKGNPVYDSSGRVVPESRLDTFFKSIGI